jgi:hypothetical protein
MTTGTLIALTFMLVLPIAGTVWVRYTTRKAIGLSRDISWSEFEADHGSTIENKEATEVH